MLNAYNGYRYGGTGSLLIRTEKIKGGQWVADWVPTVANNTSTQKNVAPQPALIIHAGMTWAEVIPIAIRNNHVITSGGEKVEVIPFLMFFVANKWLLDSRGIRRMDNGWRSRSFIK
jgi:hypothetical protein